jgi:hypothetical protein
MKFSGIRFQSGFLLCGICLIALLPVKPVQDRVNGSLQAAAVDPDLLYFSSPSMIRSLAFGYDSLIADVYWMRVIQYYGRRAEADQRTVRYKNLAALLDITTTLDPDLLDAYSAGATFLSEPEPVGAGQPKEALKLMDKGIAHHPDNWRLRYDKGMVHYFYLQEYKAAGEIWHEASKLAGAPYWMEALAAMSLTKGGEMDSAIALWQLQYQESSRADIRENAKNHLLSYRVAQECWTLEYLAELYRTKLGSFPGSLEDLVRAGILKQVPVDPSGIPYDYNGRTGEAQLDPSTHVKYIDVPLFYKAPFMERLRNQRR